MLFHVGHAGVAELKCVSVEYFVQWVGWRETCVYYVQEFPTYVSLYVSVVGWVVPCYVASPLSPVAVWLGGGVLVF